MHTHLSLFEGDENAFYDPSDATNFLEIVVISSLVCFTMRVK